MNVLKKVAKKVENSKIVKNPKFLVIGLIIIVFIISLIYFIFLKYSPIMNFKYEGYAISGKEITENLLGYSAENDSSTSKNIKLTKIEEQGTIFKKLNNYFVGNREKTEINLNYPIYINGNSSLYNLSEGSTLISKNFEEISSYPNLSISEGKIYDGNNLERADAKEYIFVKTTDNIYINLYEIKVKTTANEYTIPVNSIIAFAENSIRYYSVNNNVLVFNQINDIDSNSNVQMVENGYIYEELLTRLGILQEESNNQEDSNSQKNIIQENTANEEVTEDNENIENEQQNTDNNKKEQNGYIKPEVRAENFTAEVYTAKSTIHIKDPSGRIVEAPTFEIYKDGKIYLRRTFSNSGEIQITGLIPDTEYEVIGKYIYLNENNQKVENTFYEGTFTTKGYDQLGSIEIQKENGEIFSNKIQLVKVKITSDLNAEVLKGINQVEIETGEIRTVLSNSQVLSLLRGEEISLETSGGLDSDSTIKYSIKFYDKNGIELKVNNGEGETRTSKEAPTVRVNIKEQDIVNVTLGLKLTNRDNVELENYKYVVTRPNGEVVQEKILSENETELLLEDLDQNQYYKISIYADYDLNDNRGKQEQVEIGNLVFATQPISTLGSLELTVENKELTSTTSTITYKINEDRTDKRLIQILNELTINIVEQPEGYGDNNNQETKEGTLVYTNTLTGDEITNLQQAGIKEIKYENLKSNTTYSIEITGNVQLGNTQESIPITYNYKEFTTSKIPAKVEIRNQFVTGNIIDFDVRIEDIDNSVLNNTVRMELRDEKNTLISLEEIETNQDYIRKTYEKLEENKTYKLRFIADQYNEGNTDETYKVNYLIKEIEIVTEPGISGEIGLTDLSRKATGKNLVDMNSDIKWYVYPNFNTGDYYGKEYNSETKTLTLGGNSNGRRAVYDLREYAGKEVTMSFKAKAVSDSQTAYIQNSKTDTNRSQIQDLTTEWKDFQYTLTVDSTGYLGFYIPGGNGIEIQELQIELGNQKTSYEEFKYVLESNYSINLEDKRDEITTNDYYIKVYEDDNLVKTDRYEEIPEENVITNAIKTYETQAEKQYKVELVIKIKDREYILSELEYNTQDTEEIKGIYNKEDFREIQPRGHYIVLGDIDLRGASATSYRFGNSNLPFEGTIDFNGYKLIKDFKNTTQPAIDTTSENAVIENVILDIYVNNTIEISNVSGFVYTNYGTIKNIQLNIKEYNNLPNTFFTGINYLNYGTIENFSINLEVPIYIERNLGLAVQVNRGMLKNGYLYGKDINIKDTGTCIGGIVYDNRDNGIIENLYNLTNINSESPRNDAAIGNISAYVTTSGIARNIYSAGVLNNINDSINNGPVIGSSSSISKPENVYYFYGQTKNNNYNRKTTPLALWDTAFQNQILNSDNAFNVDDLVTQGYYPQLDWPNCMPAQEYIELPEVEDKDLADILSIEVLEQGTTTVKVKFRVNNPSAETITNIKIENLNCDILSQEYNDGTSDVIAELNNPIICVSGYSVLGITTKGAYNQEYTREFEKNERLIDVELYREINSISDWEAINKSLSENYKLMADLDMRNQGTNICIGVYNGIFDGNNHTIKNISIPSNKDGIFSGNLPGTIKNLYVENIDIIDNKTNKFGFVGGINGGNIENVHISDMEIKISYYDRYTDAYIGGISTWGNGGKIKNSSVNNLTIDIANSTSNFSIGGIFGWGYNTYIENSYVRNFEIKTSNVNISGIGGISGSGGIVYIDNCYAIGEIESDGSNVGGIAGYANQYINNCYSKVDIISKSDYIGGLVGNSVRTKNDYSNNLVLGNIYSSKYTQNMRRMIGNLELTGNNYAYSNQRINGYISEENMGASELLDYDDLTAENTYLNKLSWGNIYDISKVNEGILPKLKYKDSDELLPNQEDIFIEDKLVLEIEKVESSKDDINNVSVRLDINNSQELEVTGIEIEGMNHTINSIVTRDGETYINLTATPIYCYDTYRISKIKYKIDGIEYEKDVAARIEQQFYKELYNFEDWQAIDVDGGIYQNYRLMTDIDFSGRTNINTNVTMARLEAVGGVKTLKNINLEFTNDEDTGLIQDITTNISDIKFENIEIQSNNSSNNIGIISTSTADMSNLEFNNITINSKSDYSGCIAKMNQSGGNNIKLTNVNVTGNGYVGGLIGYYGAPKYTISDIMADNITINATGNYVGGILGQGTTDSQIANATIENSNISGNTYVGGLFGWMYYNTWPNGTQNLKAENNIINGQSYIGGVGGRANAVLNYESEKNQISGIKNVGGVLGESIGVAQRMYSIENIIIANDVNADGIGGIAGISAVGNSIMSVMNCTIESLGNNIGGIFGKVSDASLSIGTAFVKNTTIKGNNNVGGVIGKFIYGDLNKTYVEATIEANSNVGGIIGYLDNTDMTAVTNTSNINNNYIANTNIEAKSNIGGLIGSIAEELYMPETYYYSNYVEGDISSEDNSTVSLGIGNMNSQNQYLKDTYYYKYSKINDENPNEQNEVFISSDKYLTEEELKAQTTYTSKLKWSSNNWDFTSLGENKYPLIKSSNLTNQEGIDIPKDSEHITESEDNTIGTQKLEEQEELEQTFEYSGKEIDTYSTYSVITSLDGSKVTRDAKLYVKDNNLYAIPLVLNSETSEGSKIVPVANNLILDNYNGKEYETVLGSDGKMYDLKEPITYPENFINSDIESIGNNLNSDSHEVEVLYKNGDKIKFNYQKGEVISLKESDTSDGVGLFDYIKERISGIGDNSADKVSNKYEESKELQDKLEKISVEEAIEKQSNSNYTENGVTTTENIETNNSLEENKYISMYNEETGQYEIYNEEELLDTNKEEVVSENEKIEANNLGEYYASEGETRNTKMGIVWIAISIIGVGIILFVLGIRGRSLNPDKRSLR